MRGLGSERAGWGRGGSPGARPKRAENGPGRRAHARSPSLARADVPARLPPLPLSRGSCRARAFIPPPPWQRRAPPSALGLARVLGEEWVARDSGFSSPGRVRRRGPVAAVLADILFAGRGLRRRGPAVGSFAPRLAGVRPVRPSPGLGSGPEPPRLPGAAQPPPPSLKAENRSWRLRLCKEGLELDVS